MTNANPLSVNLLRDINPWHNPAIAVYYQSNGSVNIRIKKEIFEILFHLLFFMLLLGIFHIKHLHSIFFKKGERDTNLLWQTFDKVLQDPFFSPLYQNKHPLSVFLIKTYASKICVKLGQRSQSTVRVMLDSICIKFYFLYIESVFDFSNCRLVRPFCNHSPHFPLSPSSTTLQLPPACWRVLWKTQCNALY